MIRDKVERVFVLLNRIKSYDHLITADSFETDTITDLKANAKDICGEAKGMIDQIKQEIDEWS